MKSFSFCNDRGIVERIDGIRRSAENP